MKNTGAFVEQGSASGIPKPTDCGRDGEERESESENAKDWTSISYGELESEIGIVSANRRKSHGRECA